VISINDPDSKCDAAPSDDVDPMIIETRAAGASAARVTVAAVRADGATAAEQVTFDGFGRLADATSIARIDINNAVASNDYRPLRIVIASGGGVRMCEPRVTDTTDPRHC
jgi:type IV fimbrial biogenesis protein FimT